MTGVLSCANAEIRAILIGARQKLATDATQAEGGDYEKIWGKATPLGRVGTIKDIGQSVVFLASSDSSYISGQTIYVDGGAMTKPNWPYEVDPG